MLKRRGKTLQDSWGIDVSHFGWVTLSQQFDTTAGEAEGGGAVCVYSVLCSHCNVLTAHRCVPAQTVTSCFTQTRSPIVKLSLFLFSL